MAIICREHNLLFIMTPRTACTAVGKLLQEELGGEYLPSQDIVDARGRIQVQRKHSTLDELLKLELLSRREADGLIKFCAVRNPFDSLVSLYIKKRHKYQKLVDDPESWVHGHPQYLKDMQFAKNHSFGMWLIKHGLRNIARTLFRREASMFGQYTRGMDFVLRYEQLDADFSELLKKAGIQRDLRIPVVNRTVERASPKYHDYYSPITRALVRLTYASDLSRFDYRF